MKYYFGNDEQSLITTLGHMAEEARERCNYNQADANKLMTQMVSNDLRFQSRGLDPNRLVGRVWECRQSGARLDLTDPALLPGGQPRPLRDRGY